MLVSLLRVMRPWLLLLLLVWALLLNLIRLGFGDMTAYNQLISHRISSATGLTLQIRHIGFIVRGITPQLQLEGITLAQSPSDSIAISIDKTILQFSILNYLLHQNALAATSVTAIGSRFTLKEGADHSWQVDGLSSQSSDPPDTLLKVGQFQLLQSRVQLSKGHQVRSQDFNLSIGNRLDEHTVQLSLDHAVNDSNLPPLQLSILLRGNPFQQAVLGEFLVKGRAVSLAEWSGFWGQQGLTQLLPKEIDVDLHGKIENSSLSNLMINTHINQFPLFDQRIQQSAELSARLRLERDKQQTWSLNVDEFVLHTPQGRSQISAHAVLSPNQRQLAINIEQLVLQDLQRMLGSIGKISPDWLFTTMPQVSGKVSSGKLFIDYHQGEPYQMGLSGQFDDISIVHSMFAVHHLSGFLAGTQQSGKFSLRSRNVALELPTLYSHPLLMSRLNGDINWQQMQAEWYLHAPVLTVDLPGIQTQTHLRLSLPKDKQSPFLNMVMSIKSPDISQLHHSLPEKAMDPDTFIWLSRALVAGKIEQGQLSYYGRLADFPFKKRPGHFNVELEVSQGTFSYSSDWPAIDHLSAQVAFINDQLRVLGHHGESGGVIIDHALVVNPALGSSPILSIDGKVHSDLADALTFLQKTPIRGRIADLNNAIKPHGLSHIAFTIRLPLQDHLAPKVNGSIALNHAHVLVNALDLSVNNICGQLQFDESGLRSELLQATALDYPLHIKIDDSAQENLIHAQGRASVNRLAEQFPLPWWSLSSGELDYHLQLHLPHPPQVQAPTLVIESNLKGVGVTLPDGLGKNPSESSAFQAKFLLSDQQNLPIELNYSDRLHANVTLSTARKQLKSGYISLGRAIPFSSQDEGFAISINTPHFSADAWASILAGIGAFEDSESSHCRQLHIISEQLRWHNIDLGHFSLALQQKGKQWWGTVDSRMAKGKIKLDDGQYEKPTLDLALSELNVESSMQHFATSNGYGHTFKLEHLPQLRLDSAKTSWRNIKLGHLTLTSETVKRGMRFHLLSRGESDLLMQLTSDYVLYDSIPSTTLVGHVHVNDMAKVLTQLNFSQQFSENVHGDFDVKLAWPESPSRIRFSQMQGEATIELLNGRLLSIEPGFGRVLGFVALAQWSKRLQLDFSDLYSQGLSFNIIKGHFALNKGVATNDHLIVDAIPANISLDGRIDLASQTVDQLVKVAPKSADAVPIAGTMIGKLSNVFSEKFTSQNYDEFFFGSQYHIIGPWKDLQMIPLHENDGLIQKMWTTLNRFPWINRAIEQTPSPAK